MHSIIRINFTFNFHFPKVSLYEFLMVKDETWKDLLENIFLKKPILIFFWGNDCLGGGISSAHGRFPW